MPLEYAELTVLSGSSIHSIGRIASFPLFSASFQHLPFFPAGKVCINRMRITWRGDEEKGRERMPLDEKKMLMQGS